MKEIEAAPCKYCKMKTKEKFYPVVQEVEKGMFYAHCPNCNHYSPYAFLGLTQNGAITNWNITMNNNKF